MVNPRSLEELSCAVSQSERFLDDNLHNGQFWPDGRVPLSDGCMQSESDLEDIHKLLHQSKDIKEHLGSLSVVVKDKVGRVQGTLLRSSHRCCILSLPNEIFCYIIEILAFECTRRYDRSGGRKVIKQLCLVSKAFRDAVASTVSLWSRLDNEYCLSEGFEARILRSRNTPLALNLLLDNEKEHEKLLHIALPLRDRFRVVSLDFWQGDKELIGNFPNIVFPKAEVVRFMMNAGDTYDLLFKEWSFPNVRALELYDGVPPPGTFRNITSLMVGSNGDYVRDYCNDFFQGLFAFLPELRCLKRLCLNFNKLMSPMERAFPEVVLPTVDFLEVVHYGPDCHLSPDAFGSILRSLSVPNATDIRFMLRLLGRSIFDPLETTWTAWTSWSDALELSEMLENVSVLGVAFGYSVEIEPGYLARLLRLFPNVQYLELRLPALDYTFGIWKEECSLHLNRLRFLSLKELDGWYFDPQQLNHVVDAFTDFPDNVQAGVNDARMSDQFSRLFTSTSLDVEP